MSPVTQTKQEWHIVWVALTDAYTDVMLSRQVLQCTPATLQFHESTLGAFQAWPERQGVTAPRELTARLVRQ